ncbi:Crp/Fnr family transcriptional regulator [Glaciecola sp. SC05]|uniref:Crp/Fnr family transcriptional regulator n=1 Tax=Glaciecola sp. SC05 TaxID=1987355 RepID=UPI0035274C57
MQTIEQKTQLPDELMVRCAEFAPILDYASGETIQNRGEFKLGLSIIYKGQIKIGNFGLDGEYQHTVTLQRADTFGEFTLFNHLPRTHHAQALGDTQLIQMSLAQFNRCAAAHPELYSFLLRSMGLKLHLALERLDDLLRLPTYIRLAKILQEYADPSGKVSLKQSDLSELLGVTVLSSHRALHKLRALGLVKTVYGGVIIHQQAEFNVWLEQQLSLGKILRADS